jgi:hypothetical protein
MYQLDNRPDVYTILILGSLLLIVMLGYMDRATTFYYTPNICRWTLLISGYLEKTNCLVSNYGEYDGLKFNLF